MNPELAEAVEAAATRSAGLQRLVAWVIEIVAEDVEKWRPLFACRDIDAAETMESATALAEIEQRPAEPADLDSFPWDEPESAGMRDDLRKAAKAARKLPDEAQAYLAWRITGEIQSDDKWEALFNDPELIELLDRKVEAVLASDEEPQPLRWQDL